jgi:hypothetical protein
VKVNNFSTPTFAYKNKTMKSLINVVDQQIRPERFTCHIISMIEKFVLWHLATPLNSLNGKLKMANDDDKKKKK